jgi:hypothetical protein
MELATFALGAALTCTAADRGSESRRAAPLPSPPPPGTERALAADELYSLRARRRAAAYLRMRILELRKARLDRAAEVIERRLPPNELLSAP